MPGEFSLFHWLIVFALIFLVFGAKRMPEIGSSMGKSIREFKKGLSGRDETEQPPLTAPRGSLADEGPKKLSQ